MGKQRKIIISGPINQEGISLSEEIKKLFPDIPVEFSLSARLELEANSEENDLVYIGKFNKALREKRSEKFEDWVNEIITSDQCLSWDKRKNGSYTFKLTTIGIVDYFPKANSLLIREKNKWKKPGLRWLINNLKLK